MSQLRVAVIGCGIIAHARYFPALQALPNLFDVRALCDSDSEALAASASWFPGAARFKDHVALLRDSAPDLDAVIVLSGGDHAPLLHDLADRAIPTLTEKPLTYTTTSAEQTSRAFAESGTPLQVGFMKRHYPVLQRMQEAIASEATWSVAIDLVHPPEDPYLVPVIGRGRAATGDLVSFLDAEAARPGTSSALDRLGVPAAELPIRRGYVLLATSVIHDIDLLTALCGAPATVPFATFWNGGLSGHAVLTWNDQRVARLTYSYVETGGYTETIRIVTPTRRYAVEIPSPYLPHTPATLATTTGSDNGLPVCAYEYVSLEDPFRRQLQSFWESLTLHEAVPIGGRHATDDLRLIDQIIHRAASSRSS